MEYESRKYFQTMLSIFLLIEKNERCMSIGGRAFHILITLLKKKCFVAFSRGMEESVCVFDTSMYVLLIRVCMCS